MRPITYGGGWEQSRKYRTVSDTSLSIFSCVVLILGIMLMLFRSQKICINKNVGENNLKVEYKQK